MPKPFEVLSTQDGSVTLLHPDFAEAYSSVHGAWMQANRLYLQTSQTHLHPQPQVLELGFGLGFNFCATLENCLARGVKLAYTSLEAYPIESTQLQALPRPLGPAGQAVWQQVVGQWDQAQPISRLELEGDWGRLEVRFEDALEARLPSVWASAVYLDPFSPAVNPQPWSPVVLQKLHTALQPGGCLVTYSVQGRFRRNLEAAGFEVQKVDGVGKKHWTRAHKKT